MMEATDVSIAELSADHLDAMERIEAHSYPTPWSRRMFEGELAKASSICVGAFDRSTPATLLGYLVVSRYVDAWHIMNVAVDHRHRRRGIARCLLNELLARTTDTMMRGYTLEVRVSNAGAIQLYESLGFVARGRRRGYYTDNREDALIMWLDPPTGAELSGGWGQVSHD